MSKNNMLLGYARGKVGSLVFNRLKGQQVTKAHNAAPSNPKTYAQMAQRCRYNTAVARYKMAQRKFFKFAYEDKRPHESDFNAFMRHNMMVGRYATKGMADAGLTLPVPLKCSSGSLVAPPTNFYKLDYVDFDDIDGGHFEGVGLLLSDLGFGWAESFEFDYSVADVSLRLISYFPFLQHGDLLTFVVYDATFDDPAEYVEDLFVFSDFEFRQFKLNVFDNTTRIQDLGVSSPVFFDTSEYPFITFSLPSLDFDSEIYAYAGLIVSRQSSSGVLVSSCVLQPNQYMIGFDEYFDYWNINAAAIASYSPSSPAILYPSK